VHPETERLCKEKGINNIEFDPVVKDAEMRSYRDQFLAKRPLGNETEITSKITHATRLRRRDRKNEFLVWTEEQSFVDGLQNVRTFSRNYCGKYMIPEFETKVVSDRQGGVKKESKIKRWIELYEVPWNEENARRIKELARDQFTLHTYLETEGVEQIWTVPVDDFEVWAKWPFDAAVKFCSNRKAFHSGDDAELSPMTPPLPEQTKNELFSKKAQVEEAPVQSKKTKSK
jgi:hypothetical protein